MSVRFEEYLSQKKVLVDKTLDHLLPPADQEPRIIHEAMRYSVFAGGKRLRPVLAIAAYEITGGQGERILPLASGLELIHTYSLIHDDLPCMDDDDFRRGRPTNHKVYGEAVAVLAGDALLPLAFECFLGKAMTEPVPHSTLAQLAERIAYAIGSKGLVGGQVMDIEKYSKDRQLSTLETTCRLKTGSLIEVSLECGATLAEAKSDQLAALREYGRALGLAFQITDDILNVTGDAQKLGKSVKSDEARDLVTFPALLGVDGARDQARHWIDRAKLSLSLFGDSAWFLNDLADYVIERQN
jgi:geranylgeranyl diphosphate synthase type II